MYCFFQETSGNSQSNSTRETGAKNGNWDRGVSESTGRAAARRDPMSDLELISYRPEPVEYAWTFGVHDQLRELATSL
jgi:hypothetical protein